MTPWEGHIQPNCPGRRGQTPFTFQGRRDPAFRTRFLLNTWWLLVLPWGGASIMLVAHAALVTALWAMMRRSSLSMFRDPHATRFTFLLTRLKPSVRALVTPRSRNTSMCGHQVSMVVASRVVSGMLARRRRSAKTDLALPACFGSRAAGGAVPCSPTRRRSRWSGRRRRTPGAAGRAAVRTIDRRR